MYAVITGATKGIGKAIAQELARQNFNLIVCAQKAAELQTLKQQIESENNTVKVFPFVCNVANKEAVQNFADFILQTTHNHPLEILVNNAGVFIPSSIFEEETDTLETLMATNVYSAYYLTKHLTNKFVEQKKGHIFNICSIASIAPYASSCAYTVSKHALYGFGRVLRQALQPHGIKVTNMHPGAVYTASWEGSGVAPERIMTSADIAQLLWAAYNLSAQATVEDIIIRPTLGDL